MAVQLFGHDPARDFEALRQRVELLRRQAVLFGQREEVPDQIGQILDSLALPVASSGVARGTPARSMAAVARLGGAAA